MRKGRTILHFALVFVAGDFLGAYLTLPPFFYLFFTLAIALCALTVSGKESVRYALLMLAALMLGAAACQVGRMPPQPAEPALRQAATRARAAFSAYLGSLLPEGDELAVVRALAIGDKGSLTRDLRAVYRDSGAMHLLALSGLHVGIIYGILSLALAPLGGFRHLRRLRVALILSFLWIFAIVSGLSPSILRAVLMITLFEISQFISGVRNGPAALALSAILSVLLNPEAPRELSFQLSYSAVAGIYLLYPRLKLLLATRSRLLNYIWTTACIAISCQLTCGLLAFLHFGTFPRYFLVTNLLAVPLATVVMYILAATLLSALALPGVQIWLAGTLEFALRLLNYILSVISGL